MRQTGCASVDVPANDGQDVIPYAMVNDLPTLAWAANLGTIELHVPLWHVGRHRKLPARPDLMVFDLDPGEGTSIVECCVVAGYVMDELARTGNRKTFAKTSGSKGLQLYATVGPRTTWDSLRDRTHEIARKLEADHRGPRGLQHAQVVAPGPRPHRLESEPPGEDDGRRLFGAGDADTNGVDARQRRRGAAMRRKEGPHDSSLRDRGRLAPHRKGRRLFAPSAWPDPTRSPFLSISAFVGEIHMQAGKGCGGQRSDAPMHVCETGQRNDQGGANAATPPTICFVEGPVRPLFEAIHVVHAPAFRRPFIDTACRPRGRAAN